MDLNHRPLPYQSGLPRQPLDALGNNGTSAAMRRVVECGLARPSRKGPADFLLTLAVVLALTLAVELGTGGRRVGPGSRVRVHRPGSDGLISFPAKSGGSPAARYMPELRPSLRAPGRGFRARVAQACARRE